MSIVLAHIDDDLSVRLHVQSLIESTPDLAVHSILSFESVDSYLASLAIRSVEILLLDLHLQQGLSLTQIEKIRKTSPNALIVILSNDLTKVGEAMQLGVHDFIRKGASDTEIKLRLKTMIQHILQRRGSPSDQSTATMDAIAKRVPDILKSAVRSILVRGETGTGKEVVAQLFRKELDSKKPFIAVNCAAITPSLMERELFGHVKGAYTGALNDSPGFVGAANGGWLFLDELGSLSLSAQAAFLRVLEAGEVIPLGSNTPIKVKFRVIAATHENLEQRIKDGTFREDLFQRLREVEFKLPPLRDRRHEISPLAKIFAAEMEGGPYVISPETLVLLNEASWDKGNVRALRNCLRAMTEKHIERVLTPQSLPPWFFTKAATEGHSKSSIGVDFDGKTSGAFESVCDEILAQMFRKIVNLDPNISLRDCAQILDLPKTSLATRLKKLVASNLLNEEELQRSFKSKGKPKHE